ncbi:hypothetical protein K9M48_01100 [Candidatus Gracilibacteria bacterium]|nr:hypothetical protein [Candidatus Gracilibacteria bacterium]
MPGFKIIEDSIKPEYLEKIKKNISEIKKGTNKFKDEISQTLEQQFGIKPNLEDPRLSESAKQI